MRVLIPFSYYHPETCAGVFVVHDLMHKLVDHGVESLLYVPTPTRNVKEGSTWVRDEYQCDGKIHIHRFHMYAEPKNFVLRALRYLLCECYYLHHMLWDRYDVAFIDSTPPIQGLKLAVVRLFRKKPVVYNAQDLFPETLSGTELANQGGLLWKIGTWVASVTFRNADKIITISQDIKKSIVAKGISPDKIEVVYNWVDENAVTLVADAENPLFDEFGIRRDKFRVVYAGNLGNAQNIKIIIDAAAQLKENPSIEFVIFGKGGLEEVIRAKIQSEGLTNIKLLPLQPYEWVPYVYSLGNVCIVACKAGLGGSAMPSKTWCIMSCGRPVLANFDEGELKHILESNDCGVFTKADDLNGFIQAIEKMSVNPTRCQEMGRYGRQFILENLTKEIGTQKYVDVIMSVIK